MDQILNAIEKVPSPVRYAISVGLAILAIMLYVFLMRLPTQDRLEQLSNKLDEQRQVLREKKQVADDLQMWQIEVQKLEVVLKEALQQLPTEVDTDQLLITIPNIAKKNALMVEKFDLGGEQRRKGYAEIPMTLQMFGSYRGIGSFAQEVGDQPRIMAVTSLDLKRTKKKAKQSSDQGDGDEETEESGVMLDIKASVVTYRFLEDGNANSRPQRRGGRR